MPLPLGTALSQPLLPATAILPSQLVQSHQLSKLSSSNPTHNFRNITVGNQERGSSFTQQQPTSTGNFQSMMGLAPGPLPPPSTSNHLNISTNNISNNHFSAVGSGGNLNSLVVGGRSSANHPAGNN